MKLITTLAVVCLSASALAQGVRYDHRVATIATNYPPGAQVPVMAIPNAQVTICVDGNCETKASIFSNQTLTVPTSNPMQADGQGNFGFWAAPGTYFYKVVEPSGKVNGIHPITLGGSGGTGPVIQVNGTPLITQSPVNFQDAGGVTFTNPSAGIIHAAAAGGGTGCTLGGIPLNAVLSVGDAGCKGDQFFTYSFGKVDINGGAFLLVENGSTAEVDGVIDPTHNNWFLSGSHLSERSTGANGGLGGIDLNIDDSAFTGGGSIGPIPIFINYAEDRAGHSSIGMELTANVGNVAASGVTGVEFDAPVMNEGQSAGKVWGYFASMIPSTLITTEQLGFLAETRAGVTITPNYCDFMGRTQTGALHESIGCGPNFASTFNGPLAVNDGTGKAGNIGLAAGTAPDAAPANTVQINAPTAVTAYSVKLPGAQGTGALTNDGAGNLSWTASGGVTSAFINVKTLGAKCDGSTDDTAALQAALSTAGNIHVVIPYSTTSCIISDVLLVHSNTWLDVDPNTKIFEASGNNVEMLRNVNLSQTISDHNITVTGGIWDDNWLGNPGVQYLSSVYNVLQSSKTSPVAGASGVLGFFGVQFLTVRNATVVNANIFSIQFAQCQDFHISDITFVRNQATISDGIHINGPSARFDIRNIYGATGDDFVALNAWDWSLSTPNSTEGDITDGYIAVLRPNSSVWAPVKMSVGTGAGVFRVNIHDVIGQSTNAGFDWGTFPDAANPSHTTGTGTIGGIRVTDASINVTTASTSGSDTYGEVAYIAANTQDVVFDGVVIDSTHLPAAGSPWLRVKAGMVATSITASNFRSSSATPTTYWFDNFGQITHFAITSGDVQGQPATYLSSTLVKNETGGSITNLEAISGSVASSLVAFWKFAEGTGTNAADSSLSANNTTLTGTTWVSQAGLANGGVSFAGTSGSHGDPASFTNLNFERTQPFSISTWFVLNNPTTGTTNPRIFSRYDGKSYDLGFNFNSPNWISTFALTNTVSSNDLEVTGPAITEGVLHNIIWTYDGSSSPAGVKMYLDGVTQTVTTSINNLSATTVNSQIPRIGGRIASQGCSSCFFQGVLGPLGVWNRVLTATDVANIQANPYAIIN